MMVCRAAPLVVVALVLGGVFAPRDGRAQGTARIFIDPPAQTVGVESGPFEVRVMVDDVTTPQGLGGYTLVVSYDPTVLRGRVVSDSGLIGSTGNTAFCPATGVDNEIGRAAHLCFTIPLVPEPGPIVTEPQELARVTFEPVAVGTTTLDLTSTSLVDPQGEPIPSTTTNGQVTVTTGAAPPSPEPPSEVAGGDEAPSGGTPGPLDEAVAGSLPRSGSGDTLPTSEQGSVPWSAPLLLGIGIGALAIGAALIRKQGGGRVNPGIRG